MKKWDKGTPHIPLHDTVTCEIITALAVICAPMMKYTKRNTAIASAATFAKNQWYDTLKNLKREKASEKSPSQSRPKCMIKSKKANEMSPPKPTS